MTRKQKRLSIIAGAGLFLAAASALTFYALGPEGVLFLHAVRSADGDALARAQRIRLGGLVEQGSIVRGQGTRFRFAVTDSKETVPVTYVGILPDSLSRGAGRITEGSLGRTELSSPTACSPSTTRTTCEGSGRKPEGKGRLATGNHFSRTEPRTWLRPVTDLALLLAFALALVQSVVPALGARTGNERLMAVGGPVAIAGFLLTALSFTALMGRLSPVGFLSRQRLENSHSLQPTIYKVTGAWGNHEGSMLLWVAILTFFGALVAVFGSKPSGDAARQWLGCRDGWAPASSFSSSSPPIPSAASCPPFEGSELNPVLQDLGLAIHPPLLYLGYVGFSVCFSFAVAALIEGRTSMRPGRAGCVRGRSPPGSSSRAESPWAPTGPITSSAGAASGSGIRSRTPPFMPWLAGTALLHSAIVMEKRSALKIWTVQLAILTFSLSLLGTFSSAPAC